MKTVIIVANCESYRIQDFVEAAATLRMRTIVASDGKSPASGAGFLEVDLDDHFGAAAEIALHVPDADAVIAADDSGVIVAAHTAQILGLEHNSIEAVAGTRDKYAMRTLLAAADVAQPGFRLGPVESIATLASEIGFPVVIKPRRLSASRGVIRADTYAAAEAAAHRANEIALAAGHDPTDGLLVEQYVPGVEVAVEAIFTAGGLEILAVIDKPVPLVGPFFAETIFVTPSRLAPETISEVTALVASGCEALGLTTGPIHGEVRITPSGEPCIIEIAARTIGGLCGRSLAFGLLGESLETLVLRAALGVPNPDIKPSRPASGVLMLPVENSGVLNTIEGLDEVAALPGITAIDITIPLGNRIEALPESDRYLGFVFAAGEDAAEVETRLREAAAALTVVIDGENVGPLLAEPAPGHIMGSSANWRD